MKIRLVQIVIISLGMILSGCANEPTQIKSLPIVVDFSKPKVVNRDSSHIMLAIWAQDGKLNYRSLDRPKAILVVEPYQILMQQGDVILQAEELQWNLGETTVTIKNGEVTLDYRKSEGKTGRILFQYKENSIIVSDDGKWLKAVPGDLVTLSAESGKIINY